MKTTTVKILGTHCKACKTLIEDVSKDVAGVLSCDVDPGTGAAVIGHDERFDMSAFKKEIDALGPYKVELNDAL